MRGRERECAGLQGEQPQSDSEYLGWLVSRPTACEACGGRRGAVMVRFECCTHGQDNTPKKRCYKEGGGFH
jgi:hypothetical protein